MRVTQINIKNFRSFGPEGEAIYFHTPHVALVGRNNVGKSNIFGAFDLILSRKNPNYITLEEENFNDTSFPIEIELKIGDVQPQDKDKLVSLPNLGKEKVAAFFKKLKKGDGIEILLRFKQCSVLGCDKENVEEAIEEAEDTSTSSSEDTKFTINLWVFKVYRKVEDIRRALIRMIKVPAVRDIKDELNASKWTGYGQLMKEVLEYSEDYDGIRSELVTINSMIQKVFEKEKEHLLKGARVVSYVDDIEFRLTKENQPSELLRNLEIFIQERGRYVNLENIGTGTQSAVIIGIFELILKSKHSHSRLFSIEEPEVFIHPHGVRYLGELLRRVAEDDTTQVIISTHSSPLVATFSPDEIIRVTKVNGKTKLRQLTEPLDRRIYQRFMNFEIAEMFFSDKVLLVEGETEKYLFPPLSKVITSAPRSQISGTCDFDRLNISIVPMGSKTSVLNFLKIIIPFGIPYTVLLDKDFFDDKSRVEGLCKFLGIDYKCQDDRKIIESLEEHKILINSKGEIEDLIPDKDVANLTGKSLEEIKKIKSACDKTSDAFKKIFELPKPRYSIMLAEYYSNTRNPIPEAIFGLIRKIADEMINAI